MFTYKGKQYGYTETVLVKHPQTREWLKFAAYRSEDGQLYARDEIEFFQRFKSVETRIPYHVQAMAALIGKIKDEENLASGEVRKFIVPEKTMKRGQRISSSEYIGEDEYCAIWVHVTRGYFKQIGLWKNENYIVPAI